MSLSFRCCEEEDALEVWKIINSRKKHIEITPEQVEFEIADGINQWYCAETTGEELILAVACLIVTVSDENDKIGNVRDLAILEDVEETDEILLRFMIQNLGKASYHMGLNTLIVEVFEDNDSQINALESMKFMEVGGCLCEARQLYKLKYCLKLGVGENRSAAHTSFCPSTADTFRFALSTEEISSLADCLDSHGETTSHQIEENNLESLIEDLFVALHATKDLVPE